MADGYQEVPVPDREVERAFRAVLNEYGPLHLDCVEYWFDERSYRTRFIGRWINTELPVDAERRVVQYHWESDQSSAPRRAHGELNFQTLWSRMAEDFSLQQAAHAQEQAMRVLAAAAPNMAMYETITEQARYVRQHIESFHSRYDFSPSVEIGPMTATSVRMRQDIQERATRELARQFDHMAARLLGVGQTSTTTADAAADRTITVEAVRQALELLTRTAGHRRSGMTFMGVDPAMGPDETVVMYYGGGRGGGRSWMLPIQDVGSKEAQEKGKKLLKEHLSEQQLAEYEQSKSFTVTAPSGNRYRIKEGRQMNIDVLDANGKRKAGICFLPEGQLVAGDCMLAQKIALETCEELALSVANKFS